MLNRLKECIADTISENPNSITIDSNFQKLGFLDIDFLDLKFRIEKEFQMDLSEFSLETLENCVTVNDMYLLFKLNYGQDTTK